MNYRKPTFSDPSTFETEIEPEIDAVDIADGDSLALLQSIYRSSSRPLAVRLRAAIAALPFERPKLAVVAKVEGADIAAQLDRAIARSKTAQPSTIEGAPTLRAIPAPLPKAVGDD
jgi:hypothetical protein